MKIKKIISRNRRDFRAIYECEHCGAVKKGCGYDDTYFHNEVIPQMKCKVCGKTSPTNYEPRKTKYEEWEEI
jgi:transcription elongation factor Elf1